MSAQELAVKHQQDRDDALREAKRIGDALIIRLYDTHDLAGLRGMDVDAMRGEMSRLADARAKAVEADRAYHLCMSQAMGE